MIKDSYIAVDALTQRNNVFTRMDARVKAGLCIAALITVFAVPDYKYALGLFGLVLALLLFIRIPLRLVLSRLALPAGLGFIVLLILVFTRSASQLFILDLWGWKLTGYQEGFALGAMIMARTLASVALLLFLSVTTPIHELGYALVYLRFPKIMVEIMLLTYRYLFVLWDEGMRIRQAQVLRLGYEDGRGLGSWKRSIKCISTLMAMVFIRAYDRAENTFDAMRARSYNGHIAGGSYKSINSRGMQ